MAILCDATLLNSLIPVIFQLFILSFLGRHLKLIIFVSITIFYFFWVMLNKSYKTEQEPISVIFEPLNIFNFWKKLALSYLMSRFYSWPLNYIGLYCTGPLNHRFFSVLYTIVLHNPRLVKSLGAKPQMWRAYCRVILRFSTMWRIIVPNPSHCSWVSCPWVTVPLKKFK